VVATLIAAPQCPSALDELTPREREVLSLMAARRQGQDRDDPGLLEDRVVHLHQLGGTVTQGPPDGEPKPGDVFEIDSLDFAGNHKRHAKRPSGSNYLRCTFQADLQPDCFGYSAIRGSLLRFHGMEIIGGTGRYHGATGRVVKNKEVPGGSDIVVRVRKA
jgi:hypothetical protein